MGNLISAANSVYMVSQKKKYADVYFLENLTN